MPDFRDACDGVLLSLMLSPKGCPEPFPDSSDGCPSRNDSPDAKDVSEGSPDAFDASEESPPTEDKPESVVLLHAAKISEIITRAMLIPNPYAITVRLPAHVRLHFGNLTECQ